MNNEQNYVNGEDQNSKALDEFKKFLGLEHFGWKLGAIIMLANTVFLFLISIVLIAGGAGAASANNYGGVPGIGMVTIGITYLIMSIIAFIPSAVISFIMLKKVEYYQSTVDTDISIARTRCTSVGMIVLCVLFNTIAAVFYIINFVKTKKNAEAFDSIEARQKNISF